MRSIDKYLPTKLHRYMWLIILHMGRLMKGYDVQGFFKRKSTKYYWEPETFEITDFLNEQHEVERQSVFQPPRIIWEFFHPPRLLKELASFLHGLPKSLEFFFDEAASFLVKDLELGAADLAVIDQTMEDGSKVFDEMLNIIFNTY